MTVLEIPDLCLVVMVGVSGSGKSTFVRRHFDTTEVLSSDALRAMVADDPTDQSATADAFAVLSDVAGRRLRRGLLTVVDATSLRPEDRRVLLDLAREADVFAVAIILDVPRGELTRRASVTGTDEGVLARQYNLLRNSRKVLRKGGFRYVHHLDGVAEIDAAQVVRTRLYHDKRDLHGPFDIIGDVHGCATELVDLLRALDWVVEVGDDGRVRGVPEHPQGRTAVFVGDLVDRGPDSPQVIAVVRAMVDAGRALCVRGNHEEKLVRLLRAGPGNGRGSGGAEIRARHGADLTLAQLAQTTDEFRTEATEFLDGLITQLVLDDGRLVVAHAGLAERYHGRTSGRVRSAALYGETTGETDRWGFPVRIDWARNYRGQAQVVYGHTPVPQAAWVNNTICIDTGCVFGGALTAMRYPEREVVSVPARATYFDAGRPLGYGHSAADDRVRARLRLADVVGKRSIRTGYGPPVSIRAENAAAALEVMSRYSVDPRWLRYLPPTMSPIGSDRDDLLESPGAAFTFFREQGISRVMCEEKHMGSRAIMVLTADKDTALRCFGVRGGSGALYTRTGRPFSDGSDEHALLARARTAATGLFDRLDATWLILDAELLPWNIKGESLVRDEFAEVSAAGRAESEVLQSELAHAQARGLALDADLDALVRRRADLGAFTDAYAGHVHPGAGIDDVRIAPFEVLACGGGSAGGMTLESRSHAWHLDAAATLADADDGVFTRTRHRVVDVDDRRSCAAAEQWWADLTSTGGERMVVKPFANAVRDAAGRLPPAGVKVRGREYLRIVYGPSYLDDLARLRSRDLRHKRSMAGREYRLGREALARHAAGAPLWQVHECVFGVLALESEPVDTRL